MIPVSSVSEKVCHLVGQGTNITNTQIACLCNLKHYSKTIKKYLKIVKAYTMNGRAQAQDTARTSVNSSRPPLWTRAHAQDAARTSVNSSCAPLWTRAWEGSEPTLSPRRETRSKQSVFTDFAVSSTKNKT